MFSKLFARITESSLMEEDIMVRYTFIMLLAIADSKGLVIGTDIAISRRLNMPLDEFRKSAQVLMAPDPDSNSPAKDGRRIIPSEGERGYELVNYLTYRQMKNAENKKEYMREYMRAKRRSCKQKANAANNVTPDVTDVTQAEEEVDGDAEPEEEAFPPANAAGAEVDEFAEPTPPTEGELFADWFKTLLPETIRLSKTWRSEWAKTYDALVRIDKRTPEQIRQVCQWARADSFWARNFMSPLKLRQRNGDKILYFDVFVQSKAKSNGTTKHPKRAAASPANAGTCNESAVWEY